MSIDSLSLSILVSEVKNTLVGGKISKIFQPEKDEIVFQIYNNKNYKLVLSANATVNRFNITSENKDNPKNAYNFCMLLRKHLSNALFVDILQMPYERVVDLYFQSKNELGYVENKHLIFELTGKTSNIILCDDNYKIYDTLKHLPISDTNRIMLPGLNYQFFEKRELLTLEQSDEIVKLVCSENEPIDKLLIDNLLGVSSVAVSEMLFGIDKNCHGLSNAQAVIEGIKRFVDGLNNPKPNVVIQSDALVCVCPFSFSSLKGVKVYFDSLNAAHDYFYNEKDKQLRFSTKSKSVHTSLKNTIARLEKKIAIQTNELATAQECETNRIFGDLILANIKEIGKLADNIVVTNYYDENCPTVTIPLDRSKTPQQNAQEYYKKYRKQKNTIIFTTKQIEQNKELLEYAQNIKQCLSNCNTTAELNEIYYEMTGAGFIRGKKKNNVVAVPSQPAKYVVDGFTIYVGKNNAQNDYLTFKFAKSNDIWLHTQNIHSAHVVIATEDKTPDESVILAAAQITAHYSQAKFGGKTAVDFCQKKYVKKPPKAKPGYVIYTNYSTLIVEANQHLELLQ